MISTVQEVLQTIELRIKNLNDELVLSEGEEYNDIWSKLNELEELLHHIKSK